MVVIKSKIPGLDELVGGGFEEGSSILIKSIPGLDNRIFAYHIMSSIKKNIVYLVENQFPNDFRKDYSNYLFSDDVLNNTIIVDAFSSGLGLRSTESYFAKDSTDVNDVLNALKSSLSNNPELIIIDSLSGLSSKYEDLSSFYSLLSSKDDALKIYLYTSWGLEESGPDLSKFDYVIELHSIEDRLLTRNYYKVVKAPGDFESRAIPYRVGFDGLAVYIPKIIITGPFHAGKTTFIHKVSTKAVSVNRMGTTIALDHGYVEHSGLSVDLFGTPGQERFEFMLDILNKDAFGVLLVVDSTKPETFQRAKLMLNHVSRYNLPYIIVANKQDLPSALKPEEVRNKIGLDAPVIGTAAISGDGCMEALKLLIDKVVKGGV